MVEHTILISVSIAFVSVSSSKWFRSVPTTKKTRKDLSFGFGLRGKSLDGRRFEEKRVIGEEGRSEAGKQVVGESRCVHYGRDGIRQRKRR